MHCPFPLMKSYLSFKMGFECHCHSTFPKGVDTTFLSKSTTLIDSASQCYVDLTHHDS